MVATAFRDYSGVLEPLPALNGAARPQVNRSGLTPSLDFPSALRRASNTGAASQPAADSSATLNALQESALPSKEEQLMKVCKDLEGFLLGILMKSMSERFAPNDAFGNSFESSFYKDMFFTEISRTLAEQGRGLGIAEAIYKDIMLKTPDEILQESMA